MSSVRRFRFSGRGDFVHFSARIICKVTPHLHLGVQKESTVCVLEREGEKGRGEKNAPPD